MKKMQFNIIRIAAAFLILAAVLFGFGFWHKHKMEKQRSELTAQINKENEVRQQLQEIISKLKTDNIQLTEDKDSLSGQIKMLTAEIDELLTQEIVVFDAGKVTDEIRNINELAAVEYRYTNVGVVDGNKQFSFWDHTIPFSGKKAVIVMDGTIKAGIDLSKAKLECNESASQIIVSLPAAKFLSNELDEGTFQSIVDEDSILNRLTADDQNELRKQIKDKAVENAEKSDVLKLAEERAQLLIRNVIEAIPNVKGKYEIVFKTIK